MAFCAKCGTELEEGATTCPNCGASVGTAQREKLNLHPHAVIAFVFSAMAFLFGFIITTAYFVSKRGIAYAEYIALVPAFVGLAFGLYTFCGGKQGKANRLAALLSIGLALFTVFYVFIGFMLVVAG